MPRLMKMRSAVYVVFVVSGVQGSGVFDLASTSPPSDEGKCLASAECG